MLFILVRKPLLAYKPRDQFYVLDRIDLDQKKASKVYN